jgi:hypothetical protein
MMAHGAERYVCSNNVREEEKIMTTKTKPIPDGYHTVTPYLVTSQQEVAP